MRKRSGKELSSFVTFKSLAYYETFTIHRGIKTSWWTVSISHTYYWSRLHKIEIHAHAHMHTHTHTHTLHSPSSLLFLILPIWSMPTARRFTSGTSGVFPQHLALCPTEHDSPKAMCSLRAQTTYCPFYNCTLTIIPRDWQREWSQHIFAVGQMPSQTYHIKSLIQSSQQLYRIEITFQFIYEETEI